MSSKRLYYVYAIINKVNGKKYIGKRGCNCNIEDDKYLGSGNSIRQAIKKEGVHNFKKLILKVSNNEDEINAFETDLISRTGAISFNTDKYYNEGNGGGRREVILTNTGETFNSISEASRVYGISVADIRRCCINPDVINKDWYKDRYTLSNGEIGLWRYLLDI